MWAISAFQLTREMIEKPSELADTELTGIHCRFAQLWKDAAVYVGHLHVGV